MPPRHLRNTVAVCATLLFAHASAGNAQLARELGLLPPDPAGPLATAAFAALPTESAFALAQLRNERVHAARLAARFTVKQRFHERGITYPAAEIFMRVFKRERSLELWVRPGGAERFELLHTYDICAMSGSLGPKRLQGDNQTPEGFYQIDQFNPRSEFHLSLHVNYPNARDRATGAEGVKLGGDIYIHGGCSSEGCLAVTDDGIRELYWLSVEARSAGQQRIPVHIFPARLETRDLEILQETFAAEPALGRFWETLKPAYDYFETHRRLPVISVDGRGEYAVNAVSAPGRRVAEPVAGEPVRTAPANTVRVPLGRPVGGG